MFRFSDQSYDKTMEDVKAFTLNLLERTRPYLSDNQLQIVADDLIHRASAEVGYQEEEVLKKPFQFSMQDEINPSELKRNLSMPSRLKKGRDLRTSKNDINGTKNEQVGKNSRQNDKRNTTKNVPKANRYEEPQVPKVISTSMIEADPTRRRLRRCYSCLNQNSSVPTTPRRNIPSARTGAAKSLNQTPAKVVVLRSATEAKKKKISSCNSPNGSGTDNVKHVPNVFERLYSMANTRCVHKKKEQS